MHSIYYFNINYSCNNRCTFCFSHNTGKDIKDIGFNQFQQELQAVTPDETDKIIINGGEPSLHPYFYDILNFIEQTFTTSTVVYTNGTLLNISKLKELKRTFFIIPIHGERTSHNQITRNATSFDQTLNRLQEIQLAQIPYGIKFILNREIVETNFQIAKFLMTYQLVPNKIFLARLIETIKARQNNVQYPPIHQLREYVKSIHHQLKDYFELVYLDMPLCFWGSITHSLKKESIPSFFFGDYKKRLCPKIYHKDIKIFPDKCSECIHEPDCSIMQSSYLTLSYKKRWIMEAE